jgi:phosphoglycolate phosphatase-like HAD superfamily hydrolase
LKKYLRSDNIIIFDFDGTLVDVWERYYKIFIEFWKVDLEIQFFKTLKWRYNDERLILKDVNVTFTEHDFENYKIFKSQNLEDKTFLSLDKLIINTENLKAIRDNYLILTMRKHKDNFYWQIQTLALSRFFEGKCVVLEPKGMDTKKNWLYENIKNLDGEIKIVGDSESDLKMVEVSKSTDVKVETYLVKSGLRDPEKIIKEIGLNAKIIKDVNEFLN